VRPEEKLLILLSYARLDDGEIREAIRLCRETDWEVLWSLAERNATAPLAWINLQRLERCLPPDIEARFEAKADEVAAANEARLDVARELFDRFARRAIPVVILKGVLFAETIYRHPHYKKMNDVDILVRREHLDAVYAVFDEMRFFSAAELAGGKPRKQEKWSHHAPPYFSRDLKCMVGTHWGLITPLSPYRLDYEGIWARVQDVDFYGRPAKAMGPTDNLHHLCIHLPYYKAGVRELADIYNLVRHEEIDWELFLREVASAGTENLVYHALSLANRLSPSIEMQESIRRVEPRVSRYYRADVARKTESLPRLLRSRSVHLSRIEKAFADLRATKRAGEKWEAFRRMWKNLLWPPAEDVARMNSIDRATLWARLRTPARIRRVFYRDVGRLLFWVIMAKCAWDVAKATLKAPFARVPQRDLAGFAAELGVTTADLRRLKEALE
jgi:hypothetical protein